MIWPFKRNPKYVQLTLSTQGHGTIEHVVKHEWAKRPRPIGAKLIWFATDGRPIYHDYQPVISGDRMDIKVPPMLRQIENDPNAQIRLMIDFDYGAY